MNNRKFFLTLLLLVLVGGALFLFLFLKNGDKTPSSEETPPSGETCLVFQSENPNIPCFKAQIEEKPVETGGTEPTSPITTCSSKTSIERDDCLKEEAVAKNDTTICDLLSGSFQKTSCKMEVSGSAPQTAIDTSLLPKTSPVKITTVSPTVSVLPTTQTPVSSVGGTGILGKTDGVLQKIIEQAEYDLRNPDPSISPQGFYERVSENLDLALYMISPYQVRPGGKAKAMGAGFDLDSTNDIHFGGNVIPDQRSFDAMTIEFVVPDSTPVGTYEAYVTNSKGSSKSNGQRIQVVVTNNPEPIPEITYVTPENPKFTDTITLHGNNLTNIQEISTSLGSAGTSLSFRPSSLEYAKYMTSAPELKGVLMAIHVYVITSAGMNEEPFVFNVQMPQ